MCAMKAETGNIKPVLVIGKDGGPDENPRFEKNINMGCKLFTEWNLDLLLEVTNAPGLSAYNKVERKMYHLSKELTGVLLPHDTYGTHLDNSGKTIDVELESKNFEAAGNTLAAIWNQLEIDGYKTNAEYIKTAPEENISQFVPTTLFRLKHVFESQYMTVYMKCDDGNCCASYRTNVISLFPHKRIPPLIPIKRDHSGILALNRTNV